MNETVLAILLGGIAGAVFGVLIGRWDVRRRERSAYERGKDSFKAEKEDISRCLGAELIKMRDSLIQQIEAYEKTLNVIENRLGTSTGLGGTPRQLGIEFSSTKEEGVI